MKLQKYLLKKEMTPEQFAKKVGARLDVVKMWLAGKAPMPDNVRRIKKATKGKVRAKDLPKITRRKKNAGPEPKLRAL